MQVDTLSYEKLPTRTPFLAVLVMTLLIISLLSGCSSTANIAVEQQFPDVVAEPRNVSAAIVFDDAFRNYVGAPNKDTSIALGASQVDLFAKAFNGLFWRTEVVNALEHASNEAELIVKPSVVEVQVAAPSDTYLNVFEVWIKYKLDIQTLDGQVLDSWFMPAYGKTPDSFMLSKSDAIREASIIALRDAGAKLILDFYRVPAVASWLARNEKLVEDR